jgi:4-hydroxy-3-methylbut-2-enyl diphosphate reductase
MVHNSAEMQRLHKLGMQTIDFADLQTIRPERILLRAHGEPPATYQIARELNIGIVDGTCPIVISLQKRISRVYKELDFMKEQIVIFGHPTHPETIGLLGQVDGNATVISTPEEISLVDPKKKVILFSQTTMDPDQFKEIEDGLKERVKGSAGNELKSSCTICGQMKKRKPGLAHFAKKHDVVLFVSGKNSSNGKMLFEFCKEINERTYWITDTDEVIPEWFAGVNHIGISGATSTSLDQLETIAAHVRNLNTS